MFLKQATYRDLLVAFSLLLGASVAACAQRAAMDLSGRWDFALDRTNLGINEKWFDRALSDKIALPGILEAQGYGDEISTKTPWVLSLYDHFWFDRADYAAYAEAGNVKVPFLAQPPRHYTGAAWYEREINIPDTWRGRRVELFLERPHWESTVWLDGKKIGSGRSLVAPHEFDLGSLAPGRHRLAIRIDNSLIMPYRPDAHSVSDSLGMAWNGIVGKMELRATTPVWIKDVQVFTKPGTARSDRAGAPTAVVRVTIGNTGGKNGSGTITIKDKQVPASWTIDGGAAQTELSFPGGLSWDEFHSELQRITVKLTGDMADDACEVTFGFRELTAEGKNFVLNGHPIYFRGTHDGGDFPLTGYPPTDVAFWRKRLQVVKDWGLNHVRFHSFCPPEAAFQAADELGIYLQPEPGMWNDVSPGTPMEKMLYEETDAMIRAYGNHPSFLMLSPSNEPKGRWKEAFDKWIAHYREVDPRRLYNNGTGHTEREVPGLAEGTDFLTMQRIGPKPLRGNSAWFGLDYGASLEGVNVPVIAHELGQWVAYPDYDVIKKFTGFMRPGNYEIFRDSLAKHGLLSKDKDFAYASGRYQLECYKEEIEANLRTPGLGGYQLLDLHDYLGQGTALVGLLDPFWESKGYVNAEEFRRFNGPTVPLARLSRRVFSDVDELSVDVELAHYGDRPLVGAGSFWRIVDDKGNVAAHGGFLNRDIPIAKKITLGKVTTRLGGWRGAYRLIVGLTGTPFENDWNFWVFPAKAGPRPPGPQILITHSWDEAEARLRAGGKVLYMPRKADLDWTSPPLDTVPVFWNRLMNPAWGRMLGLWIDKHHPALADFPTGSYFDWQWTEIVRGARAVNLDRLPKDLQPIVQPIDDWNRNYKLGLLFEAKVGRGKLLVSSADLENDLGKRMAARQLRESVLRYMASSRFDPKAVVTPAAFRSSLFPTRIMRRLGAKITGPTDAASAIDGDPNSFWLAGDAKDTSRKPQSLIISFPKAVDLSGFVVMPRQNHREHEGDIRDYLIEMSEDGTTWSELTHGALTSSFEPQTIDLGRTVAARFVRFTALSGFGLDKVSAMAEIAVIYAGPRLPDDDLDLEYRRVKSASSDIDEVPNRDDKKVIKP